MSTGVPELIDIETLARRLGDSVRHVRRLVAEKRVPYLKVGHFIRFDPEEIAAWLETQRVDVYDRPGSPPVLGKRPTPRQPGGDTSTVDSSSDGQRRRRSGGETAAMRLWQ